MVKRDDGTMVEVTIPEDEPEIFVVAVEEEDADEFAQECEARVFDVTFNIGSAIVWYGLRDSFRADGWREQGVEEAYLPGDGPDFWASSDLLAAIRASDTLDFRDIGDLAEEAVYSTVRKVSP